MKFYSSLAIFIAALAFSFPAFHSFSNLLDGQEHASGDHDVHSVNGHDSHETEATEHSSGEHHVQHKIIVTSPIVQDVVTTERYVGQIHSRQHIEVRALEGGYLQQIPVKEGQTVKRGDLLFKILPVLYKAKLDSDLAEAELAQVEYDNTRKLVSQNIVSDQELRLASARLAKANAMVELAKAELDFTDVRAPFDGIVDRQLNQLGSLIEEGDVLTTLSDNSVMWVYFNVPEARYLEYKSELDKKTEEITIDLGLANGNAFAHSGTIGAIEADFDNTTGNIPFRADFPNPEGLLRNGQTGTVLIHRNLKNAVVIPQRATFEILAKQYVFVVDQDDIVRQREIAVQNVLEDVYVLKDGVQPEDRIIFEGTRQVRDGDKIEFQYLEPDKILSNLKNHAE